MRTYQDLLAVGQDEKERMQFITKCIAEHKSSTAYRIAMDAELYYRHLNPTIMRAQKIIYDLMGRAQLDVWSANHKIPCRYYFYFITQAVQFLLGNGISFTEESTVDRLGNGFDKAVMQAVTMALNGGVSFGFWNNDHLEVFGIASSTGEPIFCPLYDEENGALRAGIRFWQIDDAKPLRATLYEEDGFTEYINRKNEEMTVLQEKRTYLQIVETSEATGTTIYSGENYPGFPIIPLFNINKQSEIVGSRETLDAYDLMASTLVNNVDEGNLIYWVIKNANGMDDIDDVKFVERLKTIKVAHVDGDAGSEVDTHTIQAPFQANEVALERLKNQLFDDFMALDVKQIAGGNITATQIMASYEPLNQKTDMLEYQVTDFIEKILALLGIDDHPSYTRSMIVNQQEAVSNILQAATYLSEEYVTKKIMEIFGDIDKYEDVMLQKMENEASRVEEADDYGGFGEEENGQAAEANGEENL